MHGQILLAVLARAALGVPVRAASLSHRFNASNVFTGGEACRASQEDQRGDCQFGFSVHQKEAIGVLDIRGLVNRFDNYTMNIRLRISDLESVYS